MQWSPNFEFSILGYIERKVSCWFVAYKNVRLNKKLIIKWKFTTKGNCENSILIIWRNVKLTSYIIIYKSISWAIIIKSIARKRIDAIK